MDGTTVDMPFWGNYGSVNERDSLTLKLSSKQTVDMATLYFYNDRQTNGYSEPSKFAVEYWDGEAWQSVRQQTRTPSAPRANYNAVYFAPVETDQFRFTFTNKDKGFTAVTEIQLFNEGGDRDHPAQNTAPSVKLAEDTSLTGNLYTTLKATCTDDGMPYDKDMSYAWEVIAAPEGAETLLSSANKPTTTISGTVEGEYTVRFTVSDGELSATGELAVTLKKGAAGGLGEDVAPDAASVESDYTSSWENLNGINNPSFEPTSSNVGTGKGWGNWSQSVGSEHYVGYTWDEAVTVGGADIYWYDDGGGTQVPSKLRMQYLDANGAWQDVNITTPFESSIAKNKYNRIEFDRVTTTRLRLYVTVRSGAAGNGIYRFKVYSSVDVASLNEVFLATKPGVMPTLPSNVTAVTSDGALISVPVTWETLTADMIATDGEVKLRGVNNSTGKMTTCTIYVRSDMDKATITSVEPVEVTTTQGIVPALPKTVKVGYNNGAFDNQTVKVTWPAITAAELANAGDVNFEGEVEGTATKAMLTIHVLKAPDDPAVVAVKELIDAIGEVTLDSGDAIDAARAAYDKLPDAKKALVDNYEKLTAAEEAYAAMVDAAAAKAAEDLIDAIGEVTVDSGDAITAAREAYDALTDAQKELVENYEKLLAAEELYEELTASAAAIAQKAAEEAKQAQEEAEAAQKAAEEAAEAAKAAQEAAEAAAAKAGENNAAAEEARKAAETAQAAAEAAQAKAEEAQKKAEEAKTGAEAARKAAEENNAAAAAEAAKAVSEALKAAEEAGRSAQSATQAAQSAAQAAESMLKAQEAQAAAEAAAAAAEAAEYARQMAETYQKVVEIKAELIDYLAEAQAAAEKAEAERKAAEEARKAAEEAALAASKYAASFELAQLLHESETLTGHAREDYAKVIEDAKAAIEAAKTPEEVTAVLNAAREALKTAGCPSTNFTDVEENGWYHTGVDFMVKNGFMNGVADDAFDVDGNLTRAQLVTILYRIAGEPESTATNPFADVADGQWYTNAVIWAAENGIVKGVNTTTFAPNDQITREQIATILFRYAKAEKVEGKLAGFPDAEKVSDYAADAMAWAVEQGLINGISESDGKTYLAPQETATRAQIAVILMRYLTAEN